MASGRPVVVSAVRALEEIVTDQVTGLLAPPQDARALADCLQQLLSSPQLRKTLGHNAREWVARDRTWALSAGRYGGVYARLGGW
jgi:glycosyltransferase involved in cell wall biosynthesis